MLGVAFIFGGLIAIGHLASLETSLKRALSSGDVPSGSWLRPVVSGLCLFSPAYIAAAAVPAALFGFITFRSVVLWTRRRPRRAD